MKFYGRDSQRHLLHQLIKRNKLQVGLIYGRKRVGKSELIKSAARIACEINLLRMQTNPICFHCHAHLLLRQNIQRSICCLPTFFFTCGYKRYISRAVMLFIIRAISVGANIETDWIKNYHARVTGTTINETITRWQLLNIFPPLLILQLTAKIVFFLGLQPV